jgi:hypothetical protein
MRYIVCGKTPQIEAWRRSRGLSPRDVVRCSTRGGHKALRGLSGDFTVVRLSSWVTASDRGRVQVDQALLLLAQHGGAITEIHPDDLAPVLGPCRACGREGSDTVVHLVPMAAGGDALDPDNLGAVHRACVA